jgi:putative methionine-R-sulfoxide reductase with GAF domain
MQPDKALIAILIKREPVKEQVRMLKSQYDLIPHKDDPYRYKELKARGLVDENGFVAMGVQNALAMIKAEEEKPKWQGKVYMKERCNVSNPFMFCCAGRTWPLLTLPRT